MTDILSREQRIDMAEIALKEGRISQGFWRKNGNDGREMVCALAAFGPDINGSYDCPADLMPEWLAKLVPGIDDGIKLADVPWFAGCLIERARKWEKLDADAWKRIHTGFRIAVIKQALASAETAQPDPAPAYWTQVKDACAQVIDALETDGDLNAARDAAYTASVTTSATASARAAAPAAARDAACAAAWAASAYTAPAASAAAASAAPAAASAAARRSSWKIIAETLFNLIDVELGEAG